MSLRAGSRLGPYEILSKIGAGGMGEVYQAKDTRLGRLVAIKTLPASLSGSIEARQRFEREAKSISQLSHPYICALHDVGHAVPDPVPDGSAEPVEFLVMELLDGETLASRVAKGPLPMSEVLRHSVQIAEALSAAHQHGILHRDLKPANVMITSSGVKLLDFGLAKAAAPAQDGRGSDEMSTATSAEPLTQPGSWVGTMPYMAPEQINGRPGDARSDLFALGAVIHEMATGRRAFPGETAIAIASAIASQDPPSIASLQPGAPAALDRLVRVCLAKDPERRWQTAHDVAIQLAAIEEETRHPVTAARASHGRAGWIPWAVAAVAVAAALFAWWRMGMGAGEVEPPPSTTLQLIAPAGHTLFYSVEAVTFALSPDGADLAFIAIDAAGTRRIWIRRVTSLDARMIAGTDGAVSVFWSPDGRSIAFFANGLLKRLDLAQGTPVDIGTVRRTIGLSGTWSPSGQILFASIEGEAVFGIPAGGGTAVEVVKADTSRGTGRMLFPSFLPNGRQFLYLEKLLSGEQWLMVGEAGKDAVRVMPTESMVQYVEPGLIVFARGGAIVGQRFDPASGQVSGEPFAIAEAVRFFLTTSIAQFSTSRNGSLVYQSSRNQNHMAWFSRSGQELDTVGSAGDQSFLRMAPSGRAALFSRALSSTGTYDVWSLDLERGGETKLTTDERSTDISPVLLESGSTLIFSKSVGGAPRLARKNLETGGEEALLPVRPFFQSVDDVSPDGQTIVYRERTERGNFDLWAIPLVGPATPTAVQTSPASEHSLRFSPDGQYYSFLSDESGRPEVYISKASGGAKTLVSSTGAYGARWNPQGGELIYVSRDLRVFSVRVRTLPSLELGASTALFVLKGMPWLDYEMSPDGKRFLAMVPDVVGDEQPLTAIVDWRPAAYR